MEIMNKNRKLKNIAMSLVAVLMVVCLAAGIVLEFGSGLFVGENDVQTASLTEDTNTVSLPEGMKKVSETAEELLARPTGGKDTFVILEIVPAPEYATWGYFVGGKEPYPEAVARAANWGTGETDNRLVSSGYTTPFRRIKDGTKIEYLASEQAYQDYYANRHNGAEGLSKGGYRVVLENVDTTNSTGYFEYVGNNRGIYRLTGTPQEEYMAQKGGDYTANFDSATDLFDIGAVTALGYDTDQDVELTDYNYDAELVCGGRDLDQVGVYCVKEATENTIGEYVIDEEETKNLSFTTEPFADWVTKQFAISNFDNIVFRKCSASDLEEGATRYNLTFECKGTSGGIIYHTENVRFNPGKGKFAARLKSDNGEYYTKVTSGQGEYNILMISFEMTADSDKNGSWVWHAATLPNDRQYSTKAEYNNGQGKLYTPDMSAVLGETTYNNVTARYKGFYERNSYVSNEYFKVLGLGIGGYDGSQTTEEQITAILQSEETKRQLRAFDATTTIEIRTKLPSEVTDADIEAADMVYIGDAIPFESLTDFLTLPGNTFTSDLATFKMVRDIYMSCVNKDIAFMINAGLETTSQPNLKTLYNLFTVFADPTVMKNFLEVKNENGTYSPIPNNGLNYIKTVDDYPGQNAAGKLVWRYQHNYWCKSGYYSTFTYDGDNHTSALNLTNDDMNVYEIGAYGGSCGDGWGNKNDSPLFPGWKRTWGSNSYIENTNGTNRWLIGHWYPAQMFQNLRKYNNIYNILKRDIFTLTITNATLNARMESVIYVDEFDEKYNIFYKMDGVAVLTKLPEIYRVQVYFDADADGDIDEDSTLIWEAINPNPELGLAATPGCPVTVTDANAVKVNLPDKMPNCYYEGYPVDVKDQFSDGAREKCFIVKVIGKKEAGTDGTSVLLDVVEQKAVSVIIRDMFELN